jgi:hypothetical protein
MSIVDYSPSELYYRHTGKAPLIGTTIAALAAWTTAAALAMAYAYTEFYVKTADIATALIVCCFAAAAGFAVYFVLKWGHVRNMAITLLISVTAAVIFFYGSWVVWECAVAREAGRNSAFWQPWQLAQRPLAVWNTALRINRVGTFTLNDRAVDGIELWIFWILEAAGLIGATILIPVLLLRNAAFCEQCGSWCKTTKEIARVQYFDEELVREHMEQKDFEYLVRLGRATKTTPIHFRLDLQSCPGCPNTNLLTINRIKITYHNGNPIERPKRIVDRLWLDAAQAESVRRLPQQLTATAQVTSSAPPPSTLPAERDASAGETRSRGPG